MAISRDTRNYPVPAETLFTVLLSLLPQVHIKVLPYTAVRPVVEQYDPAAGEIRVLAAGPDSNFQPYHFNFFCDNLEAGQSRVRGEASTFGVSDLGLGQLTLRQLFITLNLVIAGKLPPGQLPVFFLELPPVYSGSPQAQAEELARKAFDLGRRGYPEEALAQFKLSLALWPEQPAAHYHAGVLQMLIGRLAESAQSFQAALASEPHHALAGAYLAEVSTRIKKVGPVEKSPFTTPPTPARPAPLPATPMRTPPAGFAQGTSQAPAGGLNEDNVPTRPVPLVHSPAGRLFLRGDGIPSPEVELKKYRTRLGRREDCDIPLMDARVSRLHAEITRNGPEYILKDLQSVNGTYLNGRRLGPGEEIRLSYGDRIKLGEIEIIFIPAGPPSL